jgi:4-amino-4-deoxy-L-arabinose transferase-like glycosyltransferase
MTDPQPGSKPGPLTDAETGQLAPEVAAPAPPRWLAWLTRRGYGVLALVCVALWLPGVVSLPALDRDESRFAESSRQMLDSGNYVDIRFGQVPRYKKPVGIYWLQAATTAAAGLGDHSHIWTYRLPSLLGATLAVWLTFWCGSLFSAEAGLIAGLLMAASILLTAEASIATTDAVLLAAVVAVQGVLLRVWRATRENAPSPSNRVLMAGWAASAAGILVKFPIVPGVALLTIAGLVAWEWWETRKISWRWLGGLKPARGLMLMTVLVAPWLIAISLESHGAFFQQSLGGDFAAKIAGGQESHGAPPGYFLVLAGLTFWPAILFVLPGIGLAVTRRAEPGMRFLLAWAGGWWLVVEAVPTKLPHYVLPAYPALAILAALWLLARRDQPRQETDWRRWLPYISAFQFLIGLGIVTAAAVMLPKMYGAGPLDLARGWPLLTAVSLAALCGLVALIIFLTGRRFMAFVPALLAALIIIPALTAGVGPRLNQLWVSERLAALVAKDRQPSDPPPMLAGYEEPSLMFALGADTVLTDGRGAAELGANKGGLALVEDGERPRFLARLAELEDSAAAVDDLSGFNYSHGGPVHVTLYRVAPLHPMPSPIVR